MDKLREDALEIVRRAIDAVLPEAAVREALGRGELAARLRETGRGRVILAAIGKAAWRMAQAASEALGDRLAGGVLITKYGHSLGEMRGIKAFEAGHPVPDENAVRGTEALLRRVRGLSPEDTVLFLVSGGGSALFELPAEGVTLKDLADVTGQLLACGADIVEVNAVRKHLSAVKGGRFAKLCAPARVLTVALSDVLGDRLDSIASGPACPDASTSEDALRVVEKYGLALHPRLTEALKRETPKKLDNATAVAAGSVASLCAAAGRAAAALGYTPLLLTSTLSCTAREAGAFLAAIAREVRASGRPIASPCVVIAGGETVVHVTGKGRGGRNQELALSACRGIRGLRDVVVVSVGSDGTDGPTDAAGGIVDGTTAEALGARGMDVEAVLRDNDAWTALKAVDSLVITGPTGTNVNDVSFALMG
ncbi:glycerate kinase type-2 family protein [Fretibacterium fastidiosum]|uniref:Glycerate 2-kinase n=1 Tax=Fretibacterium fastidiosum TaxID=651822 RepID=A0AB94IW02_9BACT|nr:glycerate kinase [Fretibacterium fastidiosum]CBL27955.1 glycerate 2-kinase [Fretibacterium fastidiosum]